MDRNQKEMRGTAYQDTVALLAEGVDRNGTTTKKQSIYFVALLAEGVDRNKAAKNWEQAASVALLAEGVDRNITPDTGQSKKRGRSPRGGRG